VTDVSALAHEPLGKPGGPGLFHHKGMQLPAYIQHIAKDLMTERGMDESRAIATAISQCKKWCAGGGGVKPDTKAKACAAVAEWERLKTQAAALPALVTIPGVDLLAAGTWDLSTGRQTFTRDDLAHAVEAAACPAVGSPVIKIGHLDDRFTPKADAPAPPKDGEPAIGQVANMRLDPSGMKVIGDLAGMPGWLGAIAGSAFPRRSIEGTYGFRCQIGHDHPFVITAVALLGVTPPGVGVLSGLPDIASLYGLTASVGGRGWRTSPYAQEGTVMAITEEDVRRAYYAASGVPATWWITELQMSPSQLIVSDGDGHVYQVPFTVDADTISFEPAAELDSYEEVAAVRGTGPVIAYASADESRAVTVVVVDAAWDGNQAVAAMGATPSAGAIKAMFAIPAATKSESKLPHHTVSGGSVGAADPDGCTAAIAAINGARGGLKGVSPGQLHAAYTHLAAHLKAAGRTPPPYSGPSASATPAAAVPGHGPLGADGKPFRHAHPHTTDGSQGSDETHDHPHDHAGDNNHAHDHAPAASGPGKEGVADMEFSDEQMAALRLRLGVPDGTEISPDAVLASLEEAAKVTASGPVPPGAVIIDAAVWQDTQDRIRKGEEARHQQLLAARDMALDAAMAAGKFPPSRRPHWEAVWDANPNATRQVLAGLTPGQVPIDEIGTALGEPDLDSEFAYLWPAPPK
jgi:hypothetical protein